MKHPDSFRDLSVAAVLFVIGIAGIWHFLNLGVNPYALTSVGCLLLSGTGLVITGVRNREKRLLSVKETLKRMEKCNLDGSLIKTFDEFGNSYRELEDAGLYQQIIHWVAIRFKQPSGRGIWLLETFKYCLPRTAREDIEVTVDELKDDMDEMRAEGFSRTRIRKVVLVRSLSCILPIVGGCIIRVAYKLTPVLAVLKALSHL